MSQCPPINEGDFVDVVLPLDVAETLVSMARRQPEPTPTELEAMTVAEYQIDTAKENSDEAED